jgi:hypothetical protein
MPMAPYRARCAKTPPETPKIEDISVCPSPRGPGGATSPQPAAWQACSGPSALPADATIPFSHVHAQSPPARGARRVISSPFDTIHTLVGLSEEERDVLTMIKNDNKRAEEGRKGARALGRRTAWGDQPGRACAQSPCPIGRVLTRLGKCVGRRCWLQLRRILRTVGSRLR